MPTTLDSKLTADAFTAALEAARAAKDPEARLEALVLAWRECPDPALADLIDVWVERLTPTLPPVGTSSGSFQQAWLARAQRARTVDLGHLFASIARGNGAHAEERVRALAGFGRNPVIARVITSWLTAPPFEGRNRVRCIGPALEVLAACADPRSVGALEQAADSASRATTVRTIGQGNWLPLRSLAQTAAQWRARHAAPLEGLEPPGAERRVDLSALWGDVFAAVDDIARRRVLADALQEQGDARGEFIALQLARTPGEKPGARERALLTQYGVEWMGPLSAVLSRPLYDGGLVTGGTVKGALDDVAALDAPAWRAMRWLEFSQRSSDVLRSVLDNPLLERLEGVVGAVDPSVIDLLQAGPIRHWNTLEIRWLRAGDVARLAAVAHKLPRVTRLILHTDQVTPVLDAFPSLETLALHSYSDFARLVAAARQTGRLKRLVFEAGQTAFAAALDLTSGALTLWASWPVPRFECPPGVSSVQVVGPLDDTAALVEALEQTVPVTASRGRRPPLHEMLEARDEPTTRSSTSLL